MRVRHERARHREAAERVRAELRIHLREARVGPLAALAGALDRRSLEPLPRAPEAVLLDPRIRAEALVGRLAEAVQEDDERELLVGVLVLRSDEHEAAPRLGQVEE